MLNSLTRFLLIGSLVLVCCLAIFLVTSAETLAEEPASHLEAGAKLVHDGRYDEALKIFTAGVEADDPACMDWLGYLYLNGLGTESKPQVAFELFRKAAERGDVNGCRNLGTMYYLAWYVEPNPEQAVKWLQKATDLGSDRAAFFLGQIYWIGDGVEPNRELAERTWTQAARLGSTDAKVALASIRQNEKRLKLFAEQGNEVARGTLKFFELRSDKKPMVGGIHYLHQGWNFCGVASSTMLSQFNGGELCQYDFAKQRAKHTWGEGSRWNELADVAAKQGQKWTIKDYPVTDRGFDDALAAVAEKLEAGQPVIVDIREDPKNPGAHSILACGFDPDTSELLVRNPAQPFPGYQVFSKARLKEIWHSQGYLEGLREPRRAIMFAETK